MSVGEDDRYGRRRVRLVDGDELVYRVWQGDELLLERRGSAETIEKVRRVFEPLRPGFKATLGAGKETDPEVAQGKAVSDNPAEQAAQLAIANAQAISDLSVRMAKQAVDVFAFTKAVCEEAVAAVRTAGQEERKQFAEVLRAQTEANARPLFSGGDVAQVLGHLGEVIRQVKGP